MIKISIIIPVYNNEPYLKICIDSILSQSLTDFEILTIDDASTDRSLKILNRYASSDNRIRVFARNTNKGAPAARNYGIKKAVGKFIMFADADDELCNDSLSMLYDTAMRFESDCVKGGILYRYKKLQYTWKNRKRSYPATIIVNARFKDFRPIWHLKEYQTYLFKRELVLNNDCFFIEDLRACQDIPFLAQVLCASNTVTIIPDNTYIHRNHSSSISHRKWGVKEYESLLKGYSIAAGILSRHGYKETAKEFCSSLIDYWNKFIHMAKLLTEQECYQIFDKTRKLYMVEKHPLWQEESNVWARVYLLSVLMGLYSQALNILKKQLSAEYRLINLIQLVCKKIFFMIRTTATSLKIIPIKNYKK